MSRYRKLTTACLAAALALGLAACGGGGSSPTTNNETEPSAPAEPMPMDVTMAVPLGKAEQDALVALLDEPGDADMLTVAAGGTATRAGVVFSCMSAYSCTFTLTNNLGKIVASVSTQKMPDADAPTVVAQVPPPPPDTFAELNAGSATTIGTITSVAIRTAASNGDDGEPGTADDVPRGAYGRNPTNGTGDQHVIGGLGLGDSGAADNSKVTLLSGFNPNGTDFTAADTGNNTPARGALLTAADDMIDVGASAITGWDSQALFRDWGDTGAGGDGGYETGALIYSNIEAATEHPFDRRLANRFVNASASYAFTVRLDGTTAGNVVLNDAVAISVSNAATEQTKSMMLDVGGAQLETLVDTVTLNSQHRGTYFGASGTFKCAEDGGCGISRKTGGSTPFGVSLAASADNPVSWVFKPDADATMMVPDQDYMVFGAWLTTPDVASGTHRLGVFYNGMAPYAPATNAFTVANAAGIRGSATYTGGAAGVYRNGAASGMFTADAMLTATFDADNDGAPDTGEYSISGRIDNFRGTDGVFLGADTQATPNDPTAGGENDWVVMLGSRAFTETGEITAAGAILGGTISGSADGVPWLTGTANGGWIGQLYGPSTDADGPIAPSGVAGQFRARNASTSVVGAFGAQKD